MIEACDDRAPAPRRARSHWRWLRFRLSTVLVLMAIVAWMMALKPSLDVGTRRFTADSRWDGKIIDFYWTMSGEDAPENAGSRFSGGIYTRTSAVWGGQVHTLRVVIAPRRMIWPLALFVAFLIWKAGWAIVAWRRTKHQLAATTE
jgi:hypothetical protein